MSVYAIASRCAGGWVAGVTGDSSAPAGCTPIAGSGNRYCCPESVARGLVGGSSLPTEATSGSGGVQVAAGGKNGNGGAVVGDDTPWEQMLEGAVNQGVNEGGGNGGNNLPPESWLSRNWPWLAVGGVGVLVVGLVAATTLSSPDYTVPRVPQV